MTGAKAAIRYAKALLDLARDREVADQIYDEMKDIFQTMSRSKDVQLLLKNPVIKSDFKKNALKAVFSEVSSLTQGLIDLMLENKRSYLLGVVAEKYIVHYNQWKGKEIAILTTVVPVTPEVEARTLAKLKTLTHAHITLQNRIDESIIGGFILRVGDWQYDASVATRLGNLKRTFNSDSYISSI